MKFDAKPFGPCVNEFLSSIAKGRLGAGGGAYDAEKLAEIKVRLGELHPHETFWSYARSDLRYLLGQVDTLAARVAELETGMRDLVRILEKF